MSAQATAWVLKNSRSKATTRCVMIAIANNVAADGEGWCYVDQICADANCHEDTYHEAVKWAVAEGELERDVREGGPKRMSGRYRPNLFRFPLMKQEVGDSPTSEDQEVGDRPPGHLHPTVGGESPPTEVGDRPTTLHPLGTVRKTHVAAQPPNHPKRGCRLPDGWTPDATLTAWADEKHPGLDLDLETAQFADHHRARGSTMKDWRSAWRTWIRNAHRWSSPKAAAPAVLELVAREPHPMTPEQRASTALNFLPPDVIDAYGRELLFEGALACVEQNPIVDFGDLAVAAEVYAESRRPVAP